MRDLLSCPHCRGTLEPERDQLRCGCSTYPVVGGIPILTPWARHRKFTLEQALARHLPSAEGLLSKILRRIAPGVGRIRSALERPEVTFLDLAAGLGREKDLDYFRYRFSDLSYLSTAALLTPIEQGPVLDLGCGAGHLVHALARRLPPAQIVGVDLNFTLLYLAKRFLVPAAHFVCADASSRLPFADGTFAAALCADTFNYLPDRPTTAAELQRVARGPLLLSRLADPSFRGRGALAPLAPDAYLELFRERAPRLYRDTQILESFLRTRALDLTRPDAAADQVLTLTAGVDSKIYDGADYFVRGGRLNPIYETQEEAGSLRLRRRFISERYARVYGAYSEFLPETLTVTREQIAAQDPELVRKLVLLDLPPHYF